MLQAIVAGAHLFFAFSLVIPRIFPTFAAYSNNENMEDNDIVMAAEPVAATLSESVSRSGLLGQVMGLSRPDKLALVDYLMKDIEIDEPFKTDELGRIILTKEMRDAVSQTERDFQEGRCLGEEAFQKKFAKWL